MDLNRQFTELLNKKNDRPVLVVMTGLPGSGKSYFLEKNRPLLDSLGFTVLEARKRALELWEEYEGDEGKTPYPANPLMRKLYDRSARELERRAIEILEGGGRVVLDTAQNTALKRLSLYEQADKRGALKICISRPCSFSIAMARNVMRGNDAATRGRVYSMSMAIQYPKKGDGEGADLLIEPGIPGRVTAREFLASP